MSHKGLIYKPSHNLEKLIVNGNSFLNFLIYYLKK